PVTRMAGVRTVASVLVHEDDFLDVATQVRSVLDDGGRDDDRDIRGDRGRRRRAIARQRFPGAAANDLGTCGESLEARPGSAGAGEAAHDVVLPPLRAPEVHDVSYRVRLDVPDHEHR